jgi:hypothetical protein
MRAPQNLKQERNFTMAKKINKRRGRISKANHGARPCTGSKKTKLKGVGRK